MIIVGMGLPQTASAHSFGRLYTLPVPLWMYLYGAAAALLLSFVVIGYFLGSQPGAHGHRSIDLSRRPWASGLRRIRVVAALRLLSVLGLLLCIATGLFGTANPFTNFNMTFFWIVFMLGFTYLTALVGDLFALINPWRVMAEALRRTLAAVAPGLLRGRPGRPLLRYPEALGYWPALLFYMAFIWIELFAYVKPFSLAVMLLAYSAINLLGIWLVGSAAWFRYCEFQGVFLRLIAKMAPLEYLKGPERNEGRLLLRAPFVGVLQERAEHMSLLVFVLFMLSSTAFDGLHETVPWVRLFWSDAYQLLKPYVGDNPMQAYPILRPLYLGYETLGLLLSPFAYLAVYLAFIRLAKIVSGSTRPVSDLALRFAFSLLPIALVYNVTHYYTLILTQGTKIASLVSDPFGFGWNLFGTAGWLRAPSIPDAGLVWHVQVGLIVFGHIVSVYIAHLEALRTFPTPRRAMLSQLPMLFLMVIFTSAGLWILSQPIKAGA